MSIYPNFYDSRISNTSGNTYIVKPDGYKLSDNVIEYEGD